MIVKVNRDIHLKVKALNQSLFEFEKNIRKEFKLLQDKAIADHFYDYKIGDKVLVKMLDSNEEVYAFIDKVSLDTEPMCNSSDLFVGLLKIKSDGTPSKHRLRGVEKIISKY